MTKEILTQDDLKNNLSYDCITGVFTRIFSSTKCVKIVDKAGCLLNNGYIQIGVLNKKYYAHRLAWLYVYGYMPLDKIDHINGDRSDNRIDNLRECNQSQNQANRKIGASNTSGIKGVFFDNHAKKWRASVRCGGARKFLGSYETKYDASCARQEYAKLVHGEFYRI